MQRRALLIAAAVVVAIGAVIGTVALARTMTRVAPQPAAEVNGEVITRQEVEEDLGLLARQYGISFEGAEGEKQRKEVVGVVLDQLIGRTLIMQEARRRGLVATEAEANAQIDQIRKRFNSDKEFADALEQRGFTLASLSARIRVDLTTRKLIPVVAGAVTVPDDAVRAEYEKNKAQYAEGEQVRARHILLSSDREAKFVLSLLRQGKPFVDLAKQYSADPGSKEQGGDLGWVNRGQMVPEFEKAAFGATPGQVVGPVRSQFGYHIILVDEKKPATQKTFDQVKDDIRARLAQAKQEAAFEAWLKDQKAKAEIKKYV